MLFLFFKRKTAYEMRISDWSSDVCSSDLLDVPIPLVLSAFSLRASIGIALYPAHGLDAETLLRHAETAKYAAVASRRDYLVYEPSLDDARTEASRLIAELHGALYNEGLGDDYQPQLPLREGLPRPLRLLPYWDHPPPRRLPQAHFPPPPQLAGPPPLPT